MPGEAGNLNMEHDGEHGGAFEFVLGKERFFLGQSLGSYWKACPCGPGVLHCQDLPRYMRASYSSLFGSDQFVMEFSKKNLKQFYSHMPQNFMGVPGRGDTRAEGTQYAAIVRKATCSNTSQAGP